MGRIVVVVLVLLLGSRAEARPDPTLVVTGSSYPVEQVRADAIRGPLVDRSGAISEIAVEHLS